MLLQPQSEKESTVATGPRPGPDHWNLSASTSPRLLPVRFRAMRPLAGRGRTPPTQPRGNRGRTRDEEPSLPPLVCSTPAYRQSSRVAEYTLNLPISCLDKLHHLRQSAKRPSVSTTKSPRVTETWGQPRHFAPHRPGGVTPERPSNKSHSEACKFRGNYPPPSTLCSGSLTMAWAPISRVASGPATLRIVPPLSDRALAGMLMPSASMSPVCTS